MTLYLDSSALVKRYVAEDGSDEVVEGMDRADSWSSGRFAFVETLRAVGLRAGAMGTGRFRRDWPSIDAIELDQSLAERAAELAIETGLRALDAMHLAAALSLDPRDLTFATWDARLHRAARERGLRTLPAKLR